MSNKVVIGLGFGDEGKGVVTNYLCSQDPNNTKVMRFSGGHQCGHKVITEDVEHVFANFGSGSILGCPTYWSKYCTFEPVGFWKEYLLLAEQCVLPKITIHPNCPVTTIYDVFANRNSAEIDYGTTGTGFFRTKKRHFQDNLRFTVQDFLLGTKKQVSEKLKAIRSYYKMQADLDLDLMFNARFHIRNRTNRAVKIDRSFDKSKHIVFEGSQGLLLDQNIGIFPHVTPSDVTPRNVLKLVDRIDEIFLVTRAYQTRHGNGPMSNLDQPVSLVNNGKETNSYNRYQGEFRTTVLDLDQLIHAKKKGIDKIVKPDTNINLVITCTDQIDTYKVTTDELGVIFEDADNFAKFIGKALKIPVDRIYINTSPYSYTIRRIRK